MNIKKFLVIFFIIIAQISFAQQKAPNSTNANKSKLNYPKVYENQIPSYSAPARIDIQAAWNFIVSASLIYWQPEMIGLDLGYISSNDLTNEPDRVLNFDSDYCPGFKVLLGTHYDYDNWNINARYTRYHAKEKEKREENIILHFFSQTETISKINTRWNPQIDYFDLEIGRPYYNGKHLILKPYVSVKGGWSKQKYKINATLNTVDQEAFYRTKTWFLGPRGALDINFLLNYDFRIFANTSLSILYQKFKTQDRFISTFFPLNFTTNFRTKTIQLTPFLEMTPGFGWGSYFDHNNWHIDVLAAYNFLYLFNQNEFLSVDALGDLMMHGLEVSLRLNF